MGGGSLSVWQAKYFVDGFGKSQQDQVRSSLQSVLDAAKKNGFQLAGWTLCLACCLDGPMMKWWDGFRKRTESELGIRLELWEATQLERLLLSPDASALHHAYFPRTVNVADNPSPERYVQDLPRPEMFEDTLFIAQLREAQLTQLQSAKREFFNAEILAREVADKGVQDEVDALNTLGATVHSLWEHRFNSACTTCMEAHLPGLHGGECALSKTIVEPSDLLHSV